MIVRCLECRGFVGRFSSAVEILATVRHSDHASVDNDVVPCARCGLLHELERPEPLPSEAEAA